MCKNRLFYSCLIAFILASCVTQRKLNEIIDNNIAADVHISKEQSSYSSNFTQNIRSSIKDTVEDRESLEVKNLKGDRIIMNAVKDEESGEMVASEQLNAIVVEAKFRNIAERNGKVDIPFNITVPKQMQDPTWQVRFQPIFYILQDTLKLDRLFITGSEYREKQLKGYELYNKFINSIIPKDVDYIEFFTYKKMLEIFIARNFKEVASLQRDSSVVDSEYVSSIMGVKLDEAVEHYTKGWLVKRNNRRLNKRDKMFNKYIKSPIVCDSVRLDSVVTTDEEITYHYVQSINTRKNLRKVELVLEGSIYKGGEQLYTMPTSDAITFYISSMVAFTNNKTKYIKRVVERNAQANTSAYIDFEKGAYRLNDTLSDNRYEIARIEKNIRDVLSNSSFVVDSLLITASCSPEGSYKDNERLAQKRAESIKSYYSNFILNYKDSLERSNWVVNLDSEGGEIEEIKGATTKAQASTSRGSYSITKNSSIKEETNSTIPSREESLLKLKAYCIPEEWDRLIKLIKSDTLIKEKSNLLSKIEEIKDLDKLERELQNSRDYPYLRGVIYPYLRTVKFNFYMHRKGMIKDTIHTTQIDTLYMQGLKALQDRDYERAITKLRDYKDYNTAVAFLCLDYNHSALEILEKEPRSAKRDYMLAVVYSRLGDVERAIELYMHSCEQDASMRFRGNLDPEISALIKKYALNSNEQ